MPRSAGAAVPCSELCRAAAGSLRPGPASPAIKFPRSHSSPQSRIWMLGLSRHRWHWEHLIFCWGPSRRGRTARSSPAGAGRSLGGCPAVLPTSSRGPRRLVPGESYSQRRRSRRCHRDAPSAAELVGDAFRPQSALLRPSYPTPREAAREMGFSIKHRRVVPFPRLSFVTGRIHTSAGSIAGVLALPPPAPVSLRGRALPRRLPSPAGSGRRRKTLFSRRKGAAGIGRKGSSSRTAHAGSVSAFLVEAPVDILFPLTSQATQKAIKKK